MAIWLIRAWRHRRKLVLVLLCLVLGVLVDEAAADKILSPTIEKSVTPYDRILSAPNIPVWRTVILGDHKSVARLRQALDAASCHIGTLAGGILERGDFAISAMELQVDLVIVTPSDLGLTGSPSLGEIHARAAERGLRLSPAEVGPQLRLQYLHQPRGEFLHIAMEPVAVRDGELAAFIVGNGGAGLLLIAAEARDDLEIPSTVRFVFVRPR